MSRSEARIAKAGESAIRAVHRLARTEAQETAREERRENRRKVLLGCAILEMISGDNALSLRVEEYVKSRLERKSDLAAFDLDDEPNFFERMRQATPRTGRATATTSHASSSKQSDGQVSGAQAHRAGSNDGPTRRSPVSASPEAMPPPPLPSGPSRPS